MPIREQLPPVLRGEVAADLSPESRAHLEALAHEAQAERALVFVRDECAGRLKQPKATLGLGEKLMAASQWEPLAEVAERALALETTTPAVRLLVRAHEGFGKPPERLSVLRRAWSLQPDDLELALKLAVHLGEAGEGEERRALLADLLPRFAADARHAGIEEAALEFVEHADLDGLLRLIEVLPTVAATGAVTECVQLLAIAFPPVAAAGPTLE